MKNPPVFSRQANIAGQQLVNNGTITASRARDIESPPKELMEAHGERLDGREAGQAGAGDQALAAVGTLNRTKNGRG